ncbi:MAG TPA: CBS domain-containing protein [Blastocatellia bacterium]|nr:CBS domain-containing protein [Blastocatellia bacterium]
MKTIGSIVKNASRDLYTVSADDSAYDAARYMAERNIGAVTVVDGTRVVGLFSERDLMKRVVAAGRDPASVRVRDVMTTELTTASPDESYDSALRKMQQAKVRHLPILEDNNFIGLISLRDLLQVDADEKAEEIRMLNTYINYVPPEFAQGA